MKLLSFVLLIVALALEACSSSPSISDEEAKSIAAARLQPIAAQRGKPISPALLSQGMTIRRQGDKVSVDIDDSTNKMLWAVIIHPDGSSEVSSMPMDE